MIININKNTSDHKNHRYRDDLWPFVLPASVALHGSISTSIYDMKVSYTKVMHNLWQQITIDEVTSFRSNWLLMAPAKMKNNFTIWLPLLSWLTEESFWLQFCSSRVSTFLYRNLFENVYYLNHKIQVIVTLKSV